MATRVFEPRTPAPEVMQTRRAWRVGDHFEVVSRSGQERYRVDVEGGMPLCTCTAAKYGRPCYHAAIVYRRLEREVA